MCCCSYAPGSYRLALPQLPATWEPHAPFVCSNVLCSIVDRYEMLHLVVVTQLLEASITEKFAADDPVAHHHNTFARRDRHRRLLRPSPGNASRYYPHLAFIARSRRRADMLASASEFTAKGTGNVLVNR